MSQKRFPPGYSFKSTKYRLILPNFLLFDPTHFWKKEKELAERFQDKRPNRMDYFSLCFGFLIHELETKKTKPMEATPISRK